MAAAHWQLSTAHSKLSAPQWKVTMAHCKLATPHWQLSTAHCKLSAPQWKVTLPHRQVAAPHERVAAAQWKAAAAHSSLVVPVAGLGGGPGVGFFGGGGWIADCRLPIDDFGLWIFEWEEDVSASLGSEINTQQSTFINPAQRSCPVTRRATEIHADAAEIGNGKGVRSPLDEGPTPDP